MYNKNIYLVTFASLRPEQLFSSSTHSSSQAGKGSVLHEVSGVASGGGWGACIPEPPCPAPAGSKGSNAAGG